MYVTPLKWSRKRYEIMQSVTVDDIMADFSIDAWRLTDDCEKRAYQIIDGFVDNNRYSKNKLAGVFYALSEYPYDNRIQSLCGLTYMQVLDQKLRDAGEGELDVDDFFTDPRFANPDMYDSVSAIHPIVRNAFMCERFQDILLANKASLTPEHLLQSQVMRMGGNVSVITEMMHEAAKFLHENNPDLQCNADRSFDIPQLELLKPEVFDISDFERIRDVISKIENFGTSKTNVGINPTYPLATMFCVRHAFLKQVRETQAPQQVVALFGRPQERIL